MLDVAPEAMAAQLEEAKKVATDLTGLVRKKDKQASKPNSSPPAKANGAAANGNGKRKADDDDNEVEAKKPRVDGSDEVEA